MIDRLDQGMNALRMGMGMEPCAAAAAAAAADSPHGFGAGAAAGKPLTLSSPQPSPTCAEKSSRRCAMPPHPSTAFQPLLEIRILDSSSALTWPSPDSV
ncbi:hypothetical protein L1887_45974 [Cichorium endivia]|nr:hypothetical protein L1887_45974 [Cichorium endivia]